MPIPTPGVATYHTNINLPAGSDAPTRESIAEPLEQLADRTAKLASFFDFTASEFVYPSTKSRGKFFGVAGATLGFKESDGSPEWKMANGGVGFAQLIMLPVAGSGRARMWIPLDIAPGSVITGFNAFVEKGADNPTAADQWGATLRAEGGFSLFPGSPSTGLTGLGSGIQRAGSGTGRAVMGESGLTHTVQAMATYYVYIEGPVTESTSDRVWGVSVAFTDPGPRP